MQRDTGTNDYSFAIGYNNSYLAAVKSFYITDSSYAFRIPPSEFYQNGFHHLAMIKNGTTYTFYFDGRYVGSKSWTNINWTSSYGSLFIAEARDHQFDFLYLRLSKGIRYTKNFIGNTPIDDVFYTVKEKDNEVYGLQN